MAEHPRNSGPTEPPQLMPARMLNEFTYCPRLFHLEWVQGEWAPSADTVAGSDDHRRVDREQGDLPSPSEIGGRSGEVRSLELHDDELGLIARLDLVLFADGAAIPVDYKHGRAPEGGLWDADRVQLGVQALLLRANDYRCEEAAVYYVGSKTRRELLVDDELVAEVQRALQDARRCAADPIPPPPLDDSPKCPRCSLVGICLPDESRRLTEPEPPAQVRRLYAARDDASPLYVQAQGAKLGKKGDRLEITERDGAKHSVRLLDTSQVCLFGNVQVSAGALAVLFEKGIPVCHFSTGGWFRGISHGVGPRNAMARIPQYAASTDAQRCLDIARGLVARKIRNSRTLLRRNASAPNARALDQLKRLGLRAERVDAIGELLGVEGAAAKVFFGSLDSLLKGDAAREFEFVNRNRRPPRDPVNALLSLTYSALARDWTVALLSVGLDPYLGMYHQPRHGKPALALDLMEEFRPLIAESVVLQVLNNGEVQSSNFVRRGGAVALTAEGRRSVFLAYERRMAHEVRHPVFGYSLSYRRLLEVQARLFARYLAGELPTYEGFTTR